MTAGSLSTLLGTRSGISGGRGAGTTKKLKAELGCWGGGVAPQCHLAPQWGGTPSGAVFGGGGGGSIEVRTRALYQLLVTLSPLSRFPNTWASERLSG